MRDNVTKRDQRDRTKINMHEDFEVKYWTKQLGVSKDELQKAVDQASAIRPPRFAKNWRRNRGARYACDL
jgi:hypothetical protein